MKHALIVALGLGLMLTSGAAAAQDYSHDHGDYHGDRGDYRNDRADYHGDARDYGHDRGDYRGRGDDLGHDWHGHGHHGRYARGDRYRGDGVLVSDYRRYGYRAPPRGYGYYRTNDGDVLLAALATGIITSVIVDGHHGY